MDLKGVYATEVQCKSTFGITWYIENFDLMCETLETIDSPKFSENDDKLKWKLQLTLAKIEARSNNKILFMLNNEDDVKRIVKGEIYLYNLDGNGLHHTIDKNTYPVKLWVSAQNVYKSLEWDKTNIRTVKIVCKLNVVNVLQDVNLKSDLMEFGVKKDFFTYWNTETTDRDRAASLKLILALRSPVYENILKKGTAEQQIRIHNRCYSRAFALFLFFDSGLTLKQDAQELYITANYYQLRKLKAMCINSLSENLSLNTIIKTFEFAEEYSLFHLKRQCLKFMVINYELLNGTPEFQAILKAYKNLCKEIDEMLEAINEGQIVENLLYSSDTKFTLKQQC